jgi:hypothetical protein
LKDDAVPSLAKKPVRPTPPKTKNRRRRASKRLKKRKSLPTSQDSESSSESSDEEVTPKKACLSDQPKHQSNDQTANSDSMQQSQRTTTPTLNPTKSLSIEEKISEILKEFPAEQISEAVKKLIPPSAPPKKVNTIIVHTTAGFTTRLQALSDQLKCHTWENCAACLEKLTNLTDHIKESHKLTVPHQSVIKYRFNSAPKLATNPSPEPVVLKQLPPPVAKQIDLLKKKTNDKGTKRFEISVNMGAELAANGTNTETTAEVLKGRVSNLVKAASRQCASDDKEVKIGTTTNGSGLSISKR